MDARRSSRTVLALASLASFWIGACRCPSPAEPGHEHGMQVEAYAAFVQHSPADPKILVRVMADITPPSSGAAGEHVLTQRVLFYGDAGDKLQGDLEKRALFIGSLPRRGDLFEPISWASGWMNQTLTATPTEYTLLAVGMFEIWTPGGIEARTVPVLKHFRNIKLTKLNVGTTDPGAGSTTSTIGASACFMTSQHLALYDVDVDYDPPQSGFHVTRISIAAGPSGGPTTNLTTITNPSPSDSPMHLSLRGRYDGSNTWLLVTVVDFEPDSGTATYGPETITLTFTGMTFSPGTLMHGE